MHKVLFFKYNNENSGATSFWNSSGVMNAYAFLIRETKKALHEAEFLEELREKIEQLLVEFEAQFL